MATMSENGMGNLKFEGGGGSNPIASWHGSKDGAPVSGGGHGVFNYDSSFN